MRIRNKTLAILGITFIFLFAFLLVMTLQIIGNGFTELEEDEVTKNVGRATSAINNKIHTLDL